MLPQIAIISALLLIICYYAWIISKYKLPSSFCAGSNFLHKYDPKLEWVPNVLTFFLVLSSIPVAWHISMMAPCLWISYVMRVLTIMQSTLFFFSGCTIGLQTPYNLHARTGEIGEITLWIWTVLACIEFNTYAIPLMTAIILFNMREISKLSSRSIIRHLLWRELQAYSSYYITMAVIIAMFC